MSNKDKVVIVTGAGSGLGRAMAERLAGDGAKVVIADIAGGEELACVLRSRGHEALAVRTDITDEASVHALAKCCLDQFGAIDALVNNAALASDIRMRPFEKISVADWRRVLEVNVIGTFLCTRAVTPHMRSRQKGRIVNLTSGTAFKGSPMMLDYVSSKGAIISMTRALARELGPDMITVNAVAPGYIVTEANLANEQVATAQRQAAVANRSLPRDGWAADVVGTVAFLSSDDAAFITGQVIAVDGGSVYH